MNRRNWMTVTAAGLAAGGQTVLGQQGAGSAAGAAGGDVPLGQYQPKSMLKVQETKVSRALPCNRFSHPHDGRERLKGRRCGALLSATK
jgi:hypothetical protein